ERQVGEMDAKKTGALIAERRKALGITVDELLAGELRADAPEPEQAAPQPSDIQRAYAAEKLADADDKLLLGGIILLLPLVYWVQVFAYLSAYGLLVTMLCIALFCAWFGWHRKKR